MKNKLRWFIFAVLMIPGSLLLLIAGIQGTIILWGAMIQWGL